MGHEIGVDPVDDAGVDISHLEQRRNLGVPGTTIDTNSICHAPDPIRVSDDHGHSRLDLQKGRIGLGSRSADPMANGTSIGEQEPSSAPSCSTMAWVEEDRERQ